MKIIHISTFETGLRQTCIKCDKKITWGYCGGADFTNDYYCIDCGQKLIDSAVKVKKAQIGCHYTLYFEEETNV